MYPLTSARIFTPTSIALPSPLSTTAGVPELLNKLKVVPAMAAVVNDDVAVLASHRGRGIAEAMLGEVERIARERGACKLTLEVLSGNTPALRLYQRVGFAGYQLDPAMGSAQFLQKWLD